MKIKTIVNAMVSAIVKGKANYHTDEDEDIAIKCYRQYRACYERIIRMVEERDEEIAELRKELHQVGWLHAIHFGDWEGE